MVVWLRHNQCDHTVTAPMQAYHWLCLPTGGRRAAVNDCLNKKKASLSLNICRITATLTRQAEDVLSRCANGQKKQFRTETILLFVAFSVKLCMWQQLITSKLHVHRNNTVYWLTVRRDWAGCLKGHNFGSQWFLKIYVRKKTTFSHHVGCCCCFVIRFYQSVVLFCTCITGQPDVHICGLREEAGELHMNLQTPVNKTKTRNMFLWGESEDHHAAYCSQR